MFVNILCVVLLLSTCFDVFVLSQNVSASPTFKPFICTSGLSPQTFHREMKSSKLALRSFLLDRDDQWPRGIIPYVIDESFNKKQVAMIQEQMKTFRSVSCVRWVRRQNQKDYVRFQHVKQPGSCTSFVGRAGGEQTIHLANECFDVNDGYQGAILHEMMHAIGFIHEQQRIDRDCYVRVVHKATESKPFDYGIVRETSLDFPYDFGSIMQYGANDVLTSKNGEFLGNRKGEFTKMDIMKLKFMYCKGKSYCQLEPNRCKQFRQAEKMCLKN